MQMVLINQFILLWIGSFVSADGPLHSKGEATKVFSILSIIGSVVTILLFYFVGRLSDKLSPKICIPSSILFKGLVLLSFLLLDSPISIGAYFTFSIFFVALLFEAVALDGYFSKNIPKEIRGVLYALMAVFGNIGQLLCSMVGGYLFDNVGPAWPFAFAGICDLVFLAFVLVMISLKKFGH